MTPLELPPKTQPEAVQLHPNVNFRWLKGGDAFLLTLTDSSRAAIDVYTDANVAAVKLWTVGTPIFSVQDASHPRVSITPYFRSRLEDVIREINAAGLSGHSVIVLPQSLAGNLMRIYAQVFASQAGTIKQHWVNNLDGAFKKLDQLIEQ